MKTRGWILVVVAVLVIGIAAGCTTEAGTDGDQDVDFTGTVEEVRDDGSFVIDGRTIMTDQNTEFSPDIGAVVQGATVDVDAERQDGDLVATEIEVVDETEEDEDDDADEEGEDAETSLTGRIEQVNEDGSFVIDGETILTDENTEFSPNEDAIRQHTEVDVDYQERDGDLVATEIEVLDETEEDEDDEEDEADEDEEASLTGMVEEVNADGSFLIDGETILTDENTEFSPNEEAIQQGAEVDVDYEEQPDGTLLATEIEIVDEMNGDDDGNNDDNDDDNNDS
jgi:flagellar basal body L-ring protein FlgH